MVKVSVAQDSKGLDINYLTDDEQRRYLIDQDVPAHTDRLHYVFTTTTCGPNFALPNVVSVGFGRSLRIDQVPQADIIKPWPASN